MNNPTLTDVRAVLDSLRDAGLSTHDIADRLALHQVKQNERGVRRWFSGKSSCRVVEYMALCQLLSEVKQ